MALISYVTPPVEDKALFDWLMWNYDRQTATEKELVTAPNYDGIVGVNGNVVVPFSPFYWHHPKKGEWIQKAIDDGAKYAGNPLIWFVDLHTLDTRRFYYGRIPQPMLGYSRESGEGVAMIETPMTMIINFDGGRYNRTIDDAKSFFTRKDWGKTISELRKLSKAVSS